MIPFLLAVRWVIKFGTPDGCLRLAFDSSGQDSEGRKALGMGEDACYLRPLPQPRPLWRYARVAHVWTPSRTNGVAPSAGSRSQAQVPRVRRYTMLRFLSLSSTLAIFGFRGRSSARAISPGVIPSYRGLTAGRDSASLILSWPIGSKVSISRLCRPANLLMYRCRYFLLM